MTSKWHFREFQAGDNLSDPDFAKALFSSDAEATIARSVVRESVQNSLDARAEKGKKVLVRFVLRTGKNAVPMSTVGRFFEGAWSHLHGDSTGLDDPPDQQQPVPFLVVEDFGTKGLTGDPAHWNPFGSQTNSFFLFFRALGRSGKQGEDRGRWGVGKFVFPLASSGHCLFGYTVPIDTHCPLAMGRMVLKTHQVNGTSFHPDGHWGRPQHNSKLILPESDAVVLEEFRQRFALKRTTEPGLSVVVPWLGLELNGKDFVSAVVSEYFLPILRAELEVLVDENGKVDQIDAGRVDQMAKHAEPKALRARLQLAMHAATWPSQQIPLSKTLPSSALDWSDDLLSEDVRTALSTNLDNGEPIALRVPLTIHRRGHAIPVGTFFDVFLLRVEGLGGQRPLIVREGITIPEAKTKYLQDHVALVVVDDGPLASLVGDAETPAHTDLQYDLIKTKYKLAGKVLGLLKSAPLVLLRTLERSTTTDDVLALAQFFPIVADEDEEGKKGKPGKTTGGTEPAPVPKLPSSPRRLRVDKIDGGFRVGAVSGSTSLPDEIAIRFAYDVRRGNPFKQYRAMDFALQQGGIELKTSGVSIVDQGNNSLVVRPSDPAFLVEVSGFDRNRDLIVRVEARQ